MQVLCVVLDVFIPTLRGRGRGTRTQLGKTTHMIRRQEKDKRDDNDKQDEEGIRLRLYSRAVR